MREIVVTEHEAGQRLDRLLRKLLPGMPLGAIFRALRSGAVRVDGRKANGDARLGAGMRLELRLPAADLAALDARAAAPAGKASGAADGAVAPWPPELVPRVVHRDEHLLVLDKPAGLAVHAGSGVAHSVAGWLDARAFGVRTATFAPSPAHRLDRGTSGLLAVGLTPAAARALAAAFREGVVEKTYHAIVHGVPAPARGTIDAPLAPAPDGGSARGPKVRVDPDGRPASTGYETVQRGRSVALLRLVPRQGRQHQLRAHLAHLWHAIVGDRRYGSPADAGRGFLLHASGLSLPHPATGAPVHFEAPLPPAFAARLARDA